MGMNPEIKAQWVAALRSGEYTQGFNQLTTLHSDRSRSHCCLGVLCEVAAKNGVGIQVREDAEDDTIRYDGAKFYLPDAIMTWAALTDDKGEFFNANEGRSTNLASHNDGGDSFAEIADLIEQYL